MCPQAGLNHDGFPAWRLLFLNSPDANDSISKLTGVTEESPVCSGDHGAEPRREESGLRVGPKLVQVAGQDGAGIFIVLKQEMDPGPGLLIVRLVHLIDGFE